MSRTAYLRQLEACRAHDVSAGSTGSRRRRSCSTATSTRSCRSPTASTSRERIPGAQLKVYADTGHIPEVERADEFNADLLAFLAA